MCKSEYNTCELFCPVALTLNVILAAEATSASLPWPEEEEKVSSLLSLGLGVERW